MNLREELEKNLNSLKNDPLYNKILEDSRMNKFEDNNNLKKQSFSANKTSTDNIKKNYTKSISKYNNEEFPLKSFESENKLKPKLSENKLKHSNTFIHNFEGNDNKNKSESSQAIANAMKALQEKIYILENENHSLKAALDLTKKELFLCEKEKEKHLEQNYIEKENFHARLMKSEEEKCILEERTQKTLTEYNKLVNRLEQLSKDLHYRTIEFEKKETQLENLQTNSRRYEHLQKVLKENLSDMGRQQDILFEKVKTNGSIFLTNQCKTVFVKIRKMFDIIKKNLEDEKTNFSQINSFSQSKKLKIEDLNSSDSENFNQNKKFLTSERFVSKDKKRKSSLRKSKKKSKEKIKGNVLISPIENKENISGNNNFNFSVNETLIELERAAFQMKKEFQLMGSSLNSDNQKIKLQQLTNQLNEKNQMINKLKQLQKEELMRI